MGKGEGDLLHLAVEGEGGRRQISVERWDGRSTTFDAMFDGRRHDFFLAVPPGEGALRMTLAGQDAAEIIEARLVREGIDACLSHYDERSVCQSITRSNWQDVMDQEKRHLEWCRALPECLQLELTKACNYRCPHCGTHGTSEVHRENNSASPMEEALLDRIAEELFPFLRRVSLVGVGEPFVAPISLIDRLMTHMDRTATRLEASTNGALLDETMVEKVRPVLSHLTFSIDAATETTYRLVRRSDQFQRVLRSFQYLTSLKEKAPLSQRFELSTAFTLMRSNASELCDFLRLSKDLGADCVYVRHLLVHFPRFQEETLVGDPQLVNPLIEEAAQEADRLGMSVFLPDLIGSIDTPCCPLEGQHAWVHCSFLWRSLVILADGSVYPCGGLSPPLLGNARDLSVPDIWNGSLIRAMRRNLDTQRPHPACAHCWYREVSYFDSPAIHDDFLSKKPRVPKEKRYDASAFISLK